MLAQQEFRRGRITRQEALAVLDRHRLYNYVGQDDFTDIELFDAPLPLRAGDIVVLMSDGIYHCLPWKEIEAVLSENRSCQQKAFDLVERINASRN